MGADFGYWQPIGQEVSGFRRAQLRLSQADAVFEIVGYVRRQIRTQSRGKQPAYFPQIKINRRKSFLGLAKIQRV